MSACLASWWFKPGPWPRANIETAHRLPHRGPAIESSANHCGASVPLLNPMDISEFCLIPGEPLIHVRRVITPRNLSPGQRSIQHIRFAFVCAQDFGLWRREQGEASFQGG
jgi:hypothetical protein